MKQSKIRSTIGIIMIGFMSVAILSGAYLLVYPPVRTNSQTQAWQANQQATADGGNLLTSTTNAGSSNTVPKVTAVADKMPVFDAETLKAYDGKNGRPAYIAFEGTVYEVGKIKNWVGGFHHGYQAGTDLTDAFANSPHTKSIFKRATIVGTYSDVPLKDQSVAATNKNTDSKTTANQSTKSDTKAANNKASDKTPTSNAKDNKAQDSAKNSNNQLPVMTLKELSKYNGKNGNSAYVAVNGIIYDVTDCWKKGKHNGLTAGSDVTKAFAGSPHSQSLLNRLPIVGSLSTATDQQKSDALNNSQVSNGRNNASIDDNDGNYKDDNDRDDDDGDDDDRGNSDNDNGDDD